MSTTNASSELIPLNDAIRAEIPGNKNPATVWRWGTRGLAGLDGQRIRLEITYCGRQPCTTRDAVWTILAEVTAARLAKIARTQQRAADVTDEELEAAGLLRRDAER
ncbi:MAG: hypothetical protein WKF77_06150 [Planctomycetaceae bacterium]